MNILGITFTIGQLIICIAVWCVLLPMQLTFMILLIRENNKLKFENLFPNSPAATLERERKRLRKEKIKRWLRLIPDE